LIRFRYLRILFHKELLRFVANPALWVLLILFFSMGALVSVSDVILERDAFNVLVVDGDSSDFLAFVDRNEPKVSVYTPEAFRKKKGLNRVVLLKLLSEAFDQDLRAGRAPGVEIRSDELSRTDLVRFRDLLVKNTFLYLGMQVPLDIRLARPPGSSGWAGPAEVLHSAEAPEDLKRMIMALLIMISLNIITFNLLTVSFVEEKQNRTTLAILLSPARSTEIALAKGLFFLVSGLSLAASLTAVYRPDLLTSPVFWATMVSGALLYMSMALIVASFVERQSTATLICLGYLFFLAGMFILAPRFTALYPIKNHLPENFLFSVLSFLFDGTPFTVYANFFWDFVAVSLVLPIVALGLFSRRLACKPPTKESRLPRWTLADCAMILAFCLLFEFVLAPMLYSLIHDLPILSRYRLSGILLLYLAVFAVPLALILPVYMRVKFKKRFREIGFQSPRPLRHLLSGATWFCAYLGGLLVVSWVLLEVVFPGLAPSDFSLLERVNPQQAMFLRTARHLLAGLGAWHWVLFGAVMGILVPVLEEAYFRGCLLPALKDRWGTRVALVGSALAFGILHLNVMLLPVYFLLGILTGLLYERTGNLLAPVAFHSLNNLASIAVLSVLL
jgi:membrane protease YdiL (CAAX protease family)